MIYIKNKVTEISQIRMINKKYTLEIDLISYKNILVMNHEFFGKIFLLEDWFNSFNQNYLIPNSKKECL